MTLYEQFVDAALEHGSAIDNKPAFAAEYLDEGATEMASEFGVPVKFAKSAIMAKVETGKGQFYARRAMASEDK